MVVLVYVLRFLGEKYKSKTSVCLTRSKQASTPFCTCSNFVAVYLVIWFLRRNSSFKITNSNKSIRAPIDKLVILIDRKIPTP